ncbi:HEPN domain-containing protein [Nodosilinea nodulosa]|uniref:HEPN domain-containing protein n=1 Tax=Nodosilinea nodulosa TaxID=416001 RepID=UPI0002D3BC81|nr:HEPN domain-containing protein [Nodosilinea nodulosa]
MDSELRIEYLIVVEEKGAICNSPDTFNNLIKSNDDLDINNDIIVYQETIKAAYKITTNEIAGKRQRYFHLTLTFQYEESELDKNIEDYTKLLRAVKSVVSLIAAKQESIEAIWDDISLYYSQKAYPLIHEIENLMRKLITNFMITKIGTNWTKESLPQAVKEDLNKNDKRSSAKAAEGYINALYGVDFIKLKNMLFDPYPQNSNIEQLRDKIAQADKIESLNLNDLKAFVPRSNWDRYFDGAIVSYPAEKLTKQWDRLYQLRCQVAHNRTVAKKDFDEIFNLVDKLRGVLKQATENLYQIHIPEEEQEVVAESLASNINELYGSFIINWKKLENSLRDRVRHLATLVDEDARRFMTFRQMLDFLANKQIITKEQYQTGRELNRVRNELVHSQAVTYTEDEIRFFTHLLVEYLHSVLREINKHEQLLSTNGRESEDFEDKDEIDGEDAGSGENS